jgi:thiol-disulfide isomerase/thioredoxin
MVPLFRIVVGLVLAGLAAAAPARAPTTAAPPAAALVGTTMQGETVDLQALRGQVVMLFFWSTDCPVCLDKLPELRRNLEGWRGKEFTIIAVNQDRAMADLKAYEQVLDKVAPPNAQMKIVWRRDPSHRDNLGDLPARVPATMIIDRKGTLVKSVTGRMAPEIWDDVAELVLN